MFDRDLELDGYEPPYLHPDYRSTVLRAPHHAPVRLPPEWFHHMPGPAFGRVAVRPTDADLTRQHRSEPLGERIIVTGRVLDGDGSPIRDQLGGVWEGG